MLKTYFVYVMANRSRTLYVGVTNNLQRRVIEHKTQRTPGFTSKYLIDRLVYFETTPNVHAALAREKQIKAWRREKKLELIETANPGWRDLSLDWAMGASQESTNE